VWYGVVGVIVACGVVGVCMSQARAGQTDSDGLSM
jgi:hypothetical protein